MYGNFIYKRKKSVICSKSYLVYIENNLITDTRQHLRLAFLSGIRDGLLHVVNLASYYTSFLKQMYLINTKIITWVLSGKDPRCFTDIRMQNIRKTLWLYLHIQRMDNNRPINTCLSRVQMLNARCNYQRPQNPSLQNLKITAETRNKEE